MANIVDKTYFTGDIDLAINSVNETEFNTFIAKIEKKYLILLLGYDLYKSYLAGITATTQKYIDLRDGKEFTVEDEHGRDVTVKWEGLADMLKYFIYYEWQRAKMTVNSLGGEKKQVDENSNPADSLILNTKITDAYNNAVERYGVEVENINYINRYYKNYYKERIKGSAYNYIYTLNESSSEYYPNWNFESISKINVFGI